MKCPNCGKEIDLEKLPTLYGNMASDGSYVTADSVCYHCKEEIQLYYPLTEIT